jgi:hypothetical protein
MIRVWWAKTEQGTNLKWVGWGNQRREGCDDCRGCKDECTEKKAWVAEQTPKRDATRVVAAVDDRSGLDC